MVFQGFVAEFLRFAGHGPFSGGAVQASSFEGVMLSFGSEVLLRYMLKG